MPLPGTEGDRLVLVGVVHRSSGGKDALNRLLAEIRPTTVTLEFSRYGLDYRLTRGPLLLQRLERSLVRIAAESGMEAADLRSHPEIVSIRTLLALPFEYEAARAYATGAGARVELIDLSEISRRKLQQVEEELVTTENLRVLLSLAPPSSVEESYRAARAIVRPQCQETTRQAFLARRRGEEGIGRRDRHMAGEIRRLLEGNGPLLHVGGWVHLVEDRKGETLFSLLEDLKPRRILLGSPDLGSSRSLE